MSTPFTPGPWRWDHHLTGRRLLANTERGLSKVVLAPFDTKFGHPDVSISPADMALIAAAPALYQALEAFTIKEGDIVAAQADALILRVPVSVIQQAAAALALARGEKEGE